ncbi:hypothetical protein L7F22_061446 [Adiantum nelumboides]|nr:hypothetical protein [Adiantum nelumboides]
MLQLGYAQDNRMGRQALKDRPTNCASSWANSNSDGVKSTLKNLKKAVAETEVKVQDGRDNSQGVIGKNVLHDCLHGETANLDSSLCCPENPCSVNNDSSDSFTVYPASMRRVESWIKALAEMNMESSLFSEVEESETEVEGELDLIRFAFDARLSPRKELQAQQARNLLLKEAAMDAFAGETPFYNAKAATCC